MDTSTYAPITLKSVSAFLKALPDERRKEFYLRDTNLRGFHLRVRPNGKATYNLQARLHGKKRAWSFGDAKLFSVKEAKETAAEYLKLISLGKDPKRVAEKEAHARSEYPILKVLEDYCKRRRNQGRLLQDSTKKTYIDGIKRNAKAWASTDIRDLTVDDLLDWYETKQNRKDINAQKLKVLRTLQAVTNWAKRRGIVNENVCEIFINDELGGYPESKIRETYISENQMQDWLLSFQRQAKPHPRYYDKRTRRYAEKDVGGYEARWIKKPTISHTQRDYILFMLLTGRRKGEASKLRWADLNMNGSMHTYVMNPDIQKGHRQNRVPMTALISSMLKWRSEQPDRHKDLVFPHRQATGPIDNTRKSLKKICHSKWCNLVDIDGKPMVACNHDTRRTFTTTAAEAGQTDEQLAKHLTHSTPSVTQRYKVSSSFLIERALLEDIVMEIVGWDQYWYMVNWYGASSYLLDRIDYREAVKDPDDDYYEKHYAENEHV